MAKILVVDDEEDILKLAGMILQDAGHGVITAKNAGEAITRAKEEEPDMVLMDVVMPGRSGFEACKILKFEPSTKNIPVIMFSAVGRAVDRKMAEEAGAEGYVTKPFAARDLIEEVEKHLPP
jgi:two-component system alkaline phosphatase synthesis response regulator PhoP